MAKSDVQRLMGAASGVTIIPIGFFLYFAIASGGIGLQLVMRVTPIIALVLLGWYRPQVAGWALIVLGIVFAGFYAATVQDLQLVPTIIVAVLFCIPLIASGALFVRAHYGSTHSAL
ncbi:hypothetical protein C4568_01750 [Candidatus Parcubacteria bacterium]|nr:MAG: hypothetical protein C4568_01750 [Candidatus Parcubacteria bacterium]